MAGTDVTGTWLADDDAELLKEGLRGGIMATEAAVEDRLVFGAASVSYTHLTLPTICSV